MPIWLTRMATHPDQDNSAEFSSSSGRHGDERKIQSVMVASHETIWPFTSGSHLYSNNTRRVAVA